MGGEKQGRRRRGHTALEEVSIAYQQATATAVIMMISYTRTLVAQCIRLGHTHTHARTQTDTCIPEGSFSTIANVTQLSQLMHNLLRYVGRKYACMYICRVQSV